MSMTPTPRDLTCAISPRTVEASLTPKAEVGSSKIRSLAPKYVALQIATAWRWPPDNVPIGRSGSVTRRIPSSWICCRAIWFHPSDIETPEWTSAHGQFGSEEKIASDAHERHRPAMLMHGGDAHGPRIARFREAKMSAIDQQFTPTWGEQTAPTGS